MLAPLAFQAYMTLRAAAMGFKPDALLELLFSSKAPTALVEGSEARTVALAHTQAMTVLMMACSFLSLPFVFGGADKKKAFIGRLLSFAVSSEPSCVHSNSDT